MEVVQFEFADIPPVSDYEFYLEMFGDTNKIQVFFFLSHFFIFYLTFYNKLFF